MPRHWIEIQLPQPSNEGDTIGFYVTGNTNEIEANLSPVLMKSNSDTSFGKDYIPCDIVAVDTTE